MGAVWFAHSFSAVFSADLSTLSHALPQSCHQACGFSGNYPVNALSPAMTSKHGFSAAYKGCFAGSCHTGPLLLASSPNLFPFSHQSSPAQPVRGQKTQLSFATLPCYCLH